MYTIFINDTVIYLTDDYKYREENSFFNYEDVDIDMILNKTEKSGLKTVYLYHKTLALLWNDFKSHFKSIEAAGGIVFNEKDEILWIYRNNRWDLPKGKIEKEESNEIAAIREVEEECGITNLVLKKYLKTTYHIYEYKEKRVLKITYWYKMSTQANQVLTPQTEEGITKVAWLNKIAMKEALVDTYDNIKLLFQP